MNSEDRIRIVNLLASWEDKFPVYEWKVAGIDVWPVIKTRIFFEKVKQARNSESQLNRVSLFASLSELVKIFSLKRCTVFFAGSKHHRLMFNNSSINRYYKPLTEYLDSKNVSYLQTEYLSDAAAGPHVLKLDRVIRFFYLPGLLTKLKKSILWKDSAYLQFLSEVDSQLSITPSKISSLILKSLFSIKRWSFVYDILFRFTKPKLVIGLWYYSNAQYGMILAAKKLGVYSVDLQHGAQGFLHPAYTFNNFQAQGVNTLPNGFWCWDEESAKHLRKWYKSNQKWIEVLGNPWVTYLYNWQGEENKMLAGINQKLIIYTHQPVQEAIDLYLIEAMNKTSDEFFWWIRLHPGTTAKEKVKIVELLKENKLSNKVKLETESEVPLPILLKHSYLHISKYSGSIVEASLMNRTSIVLEEIGCSTFTELINNGMAFGLPIPTAEKIISLMTHHNGNEDLKIADYKTILDRYL